MGRSESGKVVIWILVYFTVLFSLFYIVTAVNSDYGYDLNNISTSGGGLPTTQTGGFCGDVRFDGQTPNFKKASLTANAMLEFGYITDEDSCTYFEGFAWTSSFNIFTWSTTNTCTGLLNYTYYDGGSTNYTTDWGGLYLQTSIGGKKVSVSELTLIKNDRNLCENLGFDWVTDEDLRLEASSNNVVSVWGVIKNSLTFNLNLSTSSVFVNDLVSFVFVWIPLIIMLFNIYIMLPFIGGD